MCLEVKAPLFDHKLLGMDSTSLRKFSLSENTVSPNPQMFNFPYKIGIILAIY